MNEVATPLPSAVTFQPWWEMPDGHLAGLHLSAVPIDNATLLRHTRFRWSLRYRGFPVGVFDTVDEAEAFAARTGATFDARPWS